MEVTYYSMSQFPVQLVSGFSSVCMYSYIDLPLIVLLYYKKDYSAIISEV